MTLLFLKILKPLFTINNNFKSKELLIIILKITKKAHNIYSPIPAKCNLP
jgi:hypothetical protein